MTPSRYDYNEVVRLISQAIAELDDDSPSPIYQDYVLWPAEPGTGMYGLDSLASFELVTLLEDDLAVTLIDHINPSIRTVGDLARVCLSQLEDRSPREGSGSPVIAPAVQMVADVDGRAPSPRR